MNEIDLELAAMQGVVEALRPLDQPARDRVLRWTIERFLGERKEPTSSVVASTLDATQTKALAKSLHSTASVGFGPQQALEQILRGLDGNGLCSALGAVVGELYSANHSNPCKLARLVGIELGHLTRRNLVTVQAGAMDVWGQLTPDLQRGFELGWNEWKEAKRNVDEPLPESQRPNWDDDTKCGLGPVEES